MVCPAVEGEEEQNLKVRHHKGQILKLHALGQQRVGADGKLYLPGPLP